MRSHRERPAPRSQRPADEESGRRVKSGRAAHARSETLARWAALLCLLGAFLLGSDRARLSAQADDPLSLPRTAALRNEALGLAFTGDAQGLKLTSFANLLTKREYLHASLQTGENPPPGDLWQPWRKADPPPQPAAEDLQRDTSALGNPFTLFRHEPDPRLFTAAEDLTITRWRSTERRLEVDFQARGLLLRGTLKVTMAPEASYWELRLHNQSTHALDATLSFPALNRVRISPDGADRLLAPHGSGITHNGLLATHYRATHPGGLAAPFLLIQGEGEGLYLVDMNRTELETSAGLTYQKAVRVSSDATPVTDAGRPAPKPLPSAGPLVALENRIRLPAGADITLGPVVLGTYQGPWSEGARRISQIRGRVPRIHRSPDWFTRESVLGEQRGVAADMGAKQKARGAATFVLTGYTEQERSDYLKASEATGGEGGLKRAIDATHEQGGRVLLHMDGALLARDADFLKSPEGSDAFVRDWSGKPVEPYPGFRLMCPGVPAWREWLANSAQRLLRVSSADGIFLDSLCALEPQPCHNPSHRHRSPHVWGWGARRLLQSLRQRLLQTNPEAVLVAAGAADLAREFVDGFVSYSHLWTGMRAETPVTRAVYPALNVFESIGAENPEDVERALAWNFASGLGLYVPSGVESPDVLAKLGRLRGLLDSLPELRQGGLALAEVRTDSERVTGRVYVGERTLVTLANLGDEPYLGAVDLPAAIIRLQDAATGLSIARNAEGRFEVAVAPRTATAWVAALAASAANP